MPVESSGWKACGIETLKILWSPLLFVLLLAFGYQWISYNHWHDTRQINQQKQIALASSEIYHTSERISTDLRFLSRLPLMKRFVEQPMPQLQSELADSMKQFADTKKLYDQVRLLGDDGMEMIRVNYSYEGSKIVPRDELQDKGWRYYFRDTMSANCGEFFVSPMDLNIEHGKIERPLKPMLRIGTPNCSSDGSKAGILLFNYRAALLTNHLREQMDSTLGSLSLLNRDGYWLMAKERDDEWGFMLSHNRSFAHRYPEEWESMIRGEGQGWIESDSGRFAYKRLRPLLADFNLSTFNVSFAPEDYIWVIVSHTTADTVREAQRQHLNSALLIWVVLAIPLWLIGVSLARARLARQALDAQLLSRQQA